MTTTMLHHVARYPDEGLTPIPRNERCSYPIKFKNAELLEGSL
jgi:hypothetical protein